MADKLHCVFQCKKTERAHIRWGQKGYINTLYDYVSALISVLYPGEERGFCCSAATMTPLWLVLLNTLYQLSHKDACLSGFCSARHYLSRTGNRQTRLCQHAPFVSVHSPQQDNKNARKQQYFLRRNSSIFPPFTITSLLQDLC